MSFLSPFECLDIHNFTSIVKKLVRRDTDGNFWAGMYGLTDPTPVFCTEFQAVRDAYVGTIPDAIQLAAQNAFACGLVDDGVWAKLDWMAVFANGDSPNMLLNWINPGTNDATAVNGPLFTPWQGVTGAAGGPEYINSNFNPATDATNYTLNSAAFGVYIRTNINAQTIDIGCYDGTGLNLIYPRFGDQFFIRVNSTNISSVANLDSRGLFIASRIGGDNIGYRNKVKMIDEAKATTGIPNRDMFILAHNNNGVTSNWSARQVSMAFISSSFTQANVDDMTDRFETMMDVFGTGVVP